MFAPKPRDEEDASLTGAPAEKKIAEETSAAESWSAHYHGLLTQAAEMAVEHEIDPELFVTAARHAYYNASPQLREQIEQTQILAQMEALRRMGTLALA